MSFIIELQLFKIIGSTLDEVPNYKNIKNTQNTKRGLFCCQEIDGNYLNLDKRPHLDKVHHNHYNDC